VVVLIGLVWIPVMMGLGGLYEYLQGVQSLLAPAIVAVFALGIFSKKITPKAGETGIVVGFIYRYDSFGLQYLQTRCAVMAFRLCKYIRLVHGIANWLIFEICLLVFVMALMVLSASLPETGFEEKLKGITFPYAECRREGRTRVSWSKMAMLLLL
jgi:SSS family solute:Na+ symporter